MKSLGKKADWIKQNSDKIWFALGMAMVVLVIIPYLVLGQDAILVYHDQLDGEAVAYFLRAKHLFEGNLLPEFMGGSLNTALIPPAPAFVLLFLGGNVFAALVGMQLLGSLTGYVGMYLVVKELAGDREHGDCKTAVWQLSLAAAIVGGLYAALPFLPVYGLAQYGIPLLLWCVLQALKGKHVKLAYGYAMIYALTSSLVLVGFGVLGVLLVWALYLLAAGKRSNEGYGAFKRVFGMWGVLLVLYILENFSLFAQMMQGGTAGESHKAEYVLTAKSFVESFVRYFTSGCQHAVDAHDTFFAVGAVVVFMCLGLGIGKSRIRVMLTALACNVAFATVAALWESQVGMAVRSKLGAVGAFQMDRLLWMAPCLWYLILGCTLSLSFLLWNFGRKRQSVTKIKRMLIVGCCAVSAAAVVVTGGRILWNSNLKSNIQKLRNPDYGMLSFRDYYAIGVLEQVEAYIRETTGMAQADYRVVSLGIDPAAALYHGFYCLDGYSNNYSLEYKHAFRQVIAPELEKSEYLRTYFDDWGNRCYLFSAEVPGYYTIEKGGFFFQNYQLDAEALAALGGDYLLSAAYIANAEETGLTLLRETPFETADSYYRIFLYEVKQ